jgi:hypothetical protein
MLAQISTLNQIRSMPSLSAAGASNGMMMKAISKKSRKNAIGVDEDQEAQLSAGQRRQQVIHSLPPTPWNNRVNTRARSGCRPPLR